MQLMQQKTKKAQKTQKTGNTLVRALAVLLALLVLSAPLTAYAAGESGGTDAETDAEAGGEGSGGTDTTTDAGSVAVTGVILSRSSVTLPENGETSVTLRASLYPAEATAACTWSVEVEAGSKELVTITPNTEDSTAATVAVASNTAAGRAKVTVKAGDYTDECIVEVSGIVVSAAETSVRATSSISMTRALYGEAVNSGGWEWYSDDPTIARVDVSSGVVYGIAEGKTTIYCKNNSFTSNEIEITVTTNQAGAIPASLTNGTLLLGSLANSILSACSMLTGDTLAYINTISVSPSQGTLYENYISPANPGTGVSSITKYYLGGTEKRQLDNVTFVPASDFQGEATITYTGITAKGDSYSGFIIVTVTPQTSQPMSYLSENGSDVRFKAADFSEYSVAVNDGRTVNYVIFTLPEAYCGTLRYRKSGDGLYNGEVDESTKYYATQTPSLDDVYFVPAVGYSGQVDIYYQGWDTAGNLYDGVIRITVSENTTPTETAEVRYTVFVGSRVYMEPADFDNASLGITGAHLRYVRFQDLPDPASGWLYVGEAGKVTSNVSYYCEDTAPLLSEVNFVPAGSSSTGTTISFTGYTVTSQSFTGRLVITVTEDTDTSSGTGSLGHLSYYTTGAAVTFDAYDFTSEISNQLPSSVMGIRLSAPDPSQGSLCYDFFSPLDYSTFNSFATHAVEDMSRVSFLPKAEYRGTVSLSYTAMDRLGNTCEGTLRIRVSPPLTSRYFHDLEQTPWAVAAVDFLKDYNITIGVERNIFSPLSPMRRGDFILMLSRIFNFEEVSFPPDFVDVAADSYYAAAIASAEDMGIIVMPSDGKLHPQEVITRQEAAVLFYRCMKAKGIEMPEGTEEDLQGFTDAYQAAPYAVEALGSLVELGILVGDGAGHLTPAASLNRAQMAVILYRALT